MRSAAAEANGGRQLPWSDALHALHLPTLQWFQLATHSNPPSARYGHAAAIVDCSPTDARQCTMSGEGLRHAVAGATSVVEIVARDRFGHAKCAVASHSRAHRLSHP